jgi:hypothetical protein
LSQFNETDSKYSLKAAIHHHDVGDDAHFMLEDYEPDINQGYIRGRSVYEKSEYLTPEQAVLAQVVKVSLR